MSSLVTSLQARTFAVWTLMSAVVRGYAAYNIHDKTWVPFSHISLRTYSIEPLPGLRSIYDMTLLSFLIAFGHFSSEILVFRTAKVSGPALSPVVVSSAYMSSKSANELQPYSFFPPPSLPVPFPVCHVRTTIACD